MHHLNGHSSDWEGVELALSTPTRSSTCPCPTTRPAVGCSVCRSWSTVCEAAGVGHVLASDAVVVDTDTQGVACSGARRATATTSRRT